MEIFRANQRHRPCASRSPLLPLRIKRNQHRLMAHQSGICGHKKRKCNTLYGKQKRVATSIEITTL
ncbi:hypothetical protein HMPREF0653_02430 [Prevotella disiens JCM 6334 = ATCC 29426]|uniref:Uncharacterized protein n=1 Tax=Prevotella disiens JCM 6334 = ATCC 29426 TaxID=1235811 RepID=A0ABN0NP80_9BACT|nr:hypothetical protein HMPREF0653_02430 [Prevotella disiens JCM 6334 = ATCC 29426]